MPPLYATRADFEGYVEGWVTDDAAALDRLLERAERDIDNLFRNVPILTTGTYAGRRFDPTKLIGYVSPANRGYEADALARSVCAQAEFRFMIGDEQLALSGPTKVTGPDFTVENAAGPDGGRRRYSPKLYGELLPLERFRVRGARAVT